jgi:hypothetical protein
MGIYERRRKISRIHGRWPGSRAVAFIGFNKLSLMGLTTQ